ncbi:coiled-coil domain-containing protein 105 [Denticeps clupeoides]|uniref:coiled-coil domain-containing protein 105 n=1 Tax=Denticeps clupeoides TaxID=299321 RepID=UPI0010A30922|nr:coiled-coil domain-containing protein 105 [Denticeps clupeoides]
MPCDPPSPANVGPRSWLEETPVNVGPRSWLEDTLRSVRRAERLVRDAHSAKLESFGRGPSGDEGPRPATAGAPHYAKARFLTAVPPPFLRDRCAQDSAGLAACYTRGVRAAEGRLRRQAARVAAESTKLRREREHVEKMLRSLRRAALANRKGAEGRTWRPPATETGRDGADHLLEVEKQDLKELKLQMESTLRDTLTQLQALSRCSGQLLAAAAERSRVLDLLPNSSGSPTVRGQTPEDPDPAGPFTPECKQVLESTKMVISQSESLREDVRQKIGAAIARQRAAHHLVNEGLGTKIAETIRLQQHLSMSSAATRQTIFRKQREMQSIGYSHGRAKGPVSSGDLFCREKLDRPLVEAYQRHPAPKLPEPSDITQGMAVLRHHLDSSEKELAELRGVRLQLVEDLHGKKAAARVDSSIIRLRRRLVQPMPLYVQIATGQHT